MCLNSTWVREPISAGPLHRESTNMHQWASVPCRARLKLAPLLRKVEEAEFYRQTSGSRRLSTVCQSRRTRAQCHFTALRGELDAGEDLGRRTETEGGERRRYGRGANPNTSLPGCTHTYTHIRTRNEGPKGQQCVPGLIMMKYMAAMWTAPRCILGRQAVTNLSAPVCHSSDTHSLTCTHEHTLSLSQLHRQSY